MGHSNKSDKLWKRIREKAFRMLSKTALVHEKEVPKKDYRMQEEDDGR